MPRFEPHPSRRPVLVTGASSGLGAGIAAGFGRAGYPVALAARRVDRCEAGAEAIRANGGDAVAVALDLTDDESIAACVRAAEAALGPLEIVVSNAGDVAPVSVVEASADEFSRQLAVNLGGVQRLLAHVVPGMIERRRGDFVAVTSEVAVRPRPHMAGYVAAKSGLEAMMDALALELEGTGVRTSMLRPGPASTEQGSTWDPAAVERAVATWQGLGLFRHPGTLRPAEVAEAVLAMVSAPRGTRWALLEMQPEAPVTTPAATQTTDLSAPAEPHAKEQP